MNCDDARKHWNLYHDSEGDAELHWRLNEHLAGCPACAEWFAKQSRFEELVAERLVSASDDAGLWSSILSQSGLVRPASNRRWRIYSSLVVCAASVLMLAAGWWLLGGGRDRVSPPNLPSLTAAWHDRLATGRTALPFESASDLKVEEYLRHEVRFPVRCPPRQDTGFAVRGAGTCLLADQPAAYVVGDVGDATVSVFILDRDSLAAFPRQQAALAVEKVHRCQEGDYEMALSLIDRNLVLVVGRASPQELLRVLIAYGTYPHRSA